MDSQFVAFWIVRITKISRNLKGGSNMAQIKLTTLFVSVISLLFLFIDLTVAQAQSYKMRIATHLSSNDSVGIAVKKLGELINANSKGKIEANVWADASLGNERVLTEMTHDGSLELCPSLSTGMARYAPELSVFELPYLYKDDAHMVRVLKAFRPVVEELLAPHNIKPLGCLDIGIRHMLNKKRSIYTVGDLKGLKMRAPNPVFVGMFNALGASATTVTWSEVYTALQSGVVDGMEASVSLIYMNRLHEQAKYLSKTYHVGGCFYFMANKKWYDNLPQDLQKLLLEAAEEASKYQFNIQMDQEKEAWGKVAVAGVKINEVKDIKEFSDKCVTFREKYAKEKGPKFEELYNKLLAVQ
jgi:tripartite ATP-independent transporter DctP family solute receptor